MPTITVNTKSQGRLTLTDKEFKSSGGEANVYLKGGIGYKIYTDSKFITPQPKLDELHKISVGGVAIPLEMIYNTRNQECGITLPWIDNSEPIVRYFTTQYLTSCGLTPNDLTKLVDSLRISVDGVHRGNVLIIDLNEMNVLVNKKTFAPTIIDMDSAQTPSFPARAIAMSIYDYLTLANNKMGFNEGTDWYSFGVLVCQLYTGLHPYGGRHPQYGKDMKERALHHVSIFNKDVTYPAAARPFSNIPKNYYDWLQRVFEQGERLVPPGIIMTVTAAVQHKTIKTGKLFDIQVLKEFTDPIRYHYSLCGTDVVETTKELHVGNKVYKNSGAGRMYAIKDAFWNKHTVVAEERSGAIDVYSDSAPAQRIVEGTIFPNQLGELRIIKENKLIKASAVFKDSSTARIAFESAASILTINADFYDGVIHENIGGLHYFKMLSGHSLFVKELQDYRVVQSKLAVLNEFAVLGVVGYKNKKYDTFFLKIKLKDMSYSVSITNDCDYVNFTIASNGTVVRILDDGEVELSHSDPSSHNSTILKDSSITADMILCTINGVVRAIWDNKLISISVRR